MQIINQRPAYLSAVYKHDYTAPFNPFEEMKTVICNPIRQPMIAGSPVTITDNNNNDITDDDIVKTVTKCCTDTIDVGAEDWCKELFSKTLAYFNPNGINTQMLFSAQAGVKAKLPYPTPTMVYTPANDIIPACKDFITGTGSYEALFASFAFYGKINSLGWYFVNDVAFEQFKQFLDQQTQTMLNVLPKDTQNMLSDFKSLKLDNLTESIKLRNDDSQNNQPGSFARLLHAKLMEYAVTTNPSLFGIMPFQLSELFVPTSMVFINLERHMHATPNQIRNEWDIIQKSLMLPPAIINNQKLTKLTAGTRAVQKIMSAAAQASKNKVTNKAAMVPFSSKPPKTIDIAKLIKRIMAKMSRVNHSQNTYKSVKMTYNKPNRRDPDDFNKKGKSVSTKYLPDIHLYVDTSGSVSEQNYKDAVMACISMAKKLNINIYFNSFSYELSQCSLLHTRDKSIKQIYAAFQKVQKVTGGTDFDNVWDYINMSKKRRRELSIMITDFEYTPRNRQVNHPENLYYVPCANVTNYQHLVRYAITFCKSCEHIDPNMRSRLLF